MTHKALIRRLQISCLGLDPIDPLRLLVDDVIEALREHAMYEVQRLGQEIEQEPVAWVQDVEFEQLPEFAFSWVKTRLHDKPLYTHPPQRTEQNFCPRCGKRTNDIHTCTPPQRTWVGLTDEERDAIEAATLDLHGVPKFFATAIEAKLKEKNT